MDYLKGRKYPFSMKYGDKRGLKLVDLHVNKEGNYLVYCDLYMFTGSGPGDVFICRRLILQ